MRYPCTIAAVTAVVPITSGYGQRVVARAGKLPQNDTQSCGQTNVKTLARDRRDAAHQVNLRARARRAQEIDADDADEDEL
jgi:hypothetical protein